MNLFRSEEHARNWADYDDALSASLMSVAEWADIFSNPFFRERGRSDYISWMRTDAGREAFIALRERLPHRGG